MMKAAAPLALSGLLGLIVLEILKVIAVPVSLWLLGLLVLGFKIAMVLTLVVFGGFVVRSAVRANRTSGE